MNWDEFLIHKNYMLIRSHGATVFGCVGTCWGGYMVARLSGYTDFRAGVAFHPATTFIAENCNQEKLYEVSQSKLINQK